MGQCSSRSSPPTACSSSSHEHAPVDLDGLPDQERAVVPGEEGDDVGDLLGLTGPAERDRPGDALEGLPRGETSVEPRVVDQARGDAIDADAVRRQLFGDGLAQGDDATLGAA